MKYLLLCLSLLATFALLAQEGERYTADFRFAPGLYPSLEDWKNQTPVRPADIMVDIDASSSKFFQYLFTREEFRYPRNNEIVYSSPDDIFGYSPDGKKMYYGTAYEFEIIGAICLLREVGQIDTYSSFIKPGKDYEAVREENSGQLYMLDFTTGDFSKLRAGKVKKILREDAELYQRYRKASGSKSEKLRAFIKEYNFRHPIYFGQ